MKKLLQKVLRRSALLVLASITLTTFTIGAENYPSVLKGYLDKLEKGAAADSGSFQGFSADRGKKLYYTKRMHTKKNENRACTTCHTDDPTKAGQTPVGKPVDPIAPKVNNQRFTDLEKIEKWFYRNCTFVLERECTNQEKGDFIAYIFTI